MNSQNPSVSERFSAFRSAVNPHPPKRIEKIKNASGKEAAISEYFGCMTFGLAQMREKLHKDAYNSLLLTLEMNFDLIF